MKIKLEVPNCSEVLTATDWQKSYMTSYEYVKQYEQMAVAVESVDKHFNQRSFAV